MKVKIYKPLPVLPAFTDEHLNSPESSYRGTVRELLLTIPAEYRQAAMAENIERTTRTVMLDGGYMMTEWVAPRRLAVASRQLATVVGEIRAQLGI